MTFGMHFSNVHLRALGNAQKEKFQVVMLVAATLGMISVLVVRFYTLFAT